MADHGTAYSAASVREQVKEVSTEMPTARARVNMQLSLDKGMRGGRAQGLRGMMEKLYPAVIPLAIGATKA